MKKIVVIILIVLFIYLIYIFNDQNLIDYMVIGDSLCLGINSYGNETYGYNDYLKSYLENNNLLHKYNNFFSKYNYTIDELISDINNNKNILYNDKTYNIKKELREADLLTISVGMDELVKILKQDNNYNNIKNDLDKFVNNMDILLEKVTQLSKSKIILLGYYNPNNNYNSNIDNIFAYLNIEYTKLCKKRNIIYIDIYEKIKENQNFLPNNFDYHLTSGGYLKIANMIIEKNKFYFF